MGTMRLSLATLGVAFLASLVACGSDSASNGETTKDSGAAAETAADSASGTDSASSVDAVDAVDAVDGDVEDLGEASEAATCDLTGTWTGTITYPLAGCGGAPSSDHPITLTLVQSGSSVTGTGSDGTTLAGSVILPHVDISTTKGTVTGEYVGDVSPACDSIEGHWSDALECDSGPFKLHRP